MSNENREASRICLLPNEVIDQIAAGEIVERPAHLVKELIENSLDAQATDINVEVSEDARSFIRVQDNGVGMLPNELPWALRRHATSKIKNTADLWRLMSFGFRGEALASAASVARLRLISKAHGATQAYMLTAEFGQIGQVQEANHPPGTSVEVYDLFAKLPARLKFLKSEAYELAQIRQTVKALSLAYPEVSFKLKIGSRLDFFYPSESLSERVKSVLDAEEPVFIHQQEMGSLRLDFVFLSPKQKAKNNKNIWLFVQNRWVTDRSLLAAIQEAYRDMLMSGEYPQCVLKLQVAPEEVDVNIHPTKSQVKFQDAGRVFSFVVRGIRQALQSGIWQEPLGFTQASAFRQDRPAENQERKTFYTPQNHTAKLAARPVQMPFSSAEFRRTQYAQKKDVFAANNSFVDWPKELRHFGESLKQLTQNLSPALSTAKNDTSVCLEKESATDTHRTTGSLASLGDKVFRDAESHEKNLPYQGFWSSLQIIGQAHLTYIITQGPKGLVIIDQHAAHERVRYETLKKEWEQGVTAWQSLLVPLVLDLSAEKREALLRYQDKLRAIGIEFEVCGPHSISVIRHSSYLSLEALPQLIDEIAQELMEYEDSQAFERKKEQWLATQACHGSIRAGEALSTEQIRELLQQMDQFPLSSFCPHGRPVAVEYTWSELEKDFCRVL